VKALDNLSGELEQMHRRKEALESEVANLANVIAQGDFSPALRGALADRERQIGEITTKLLEARPDSLRSKLRNIRSFVVSRMQNFGLSSTLTSPMCAQNWQSTSKESRSLRTAKRTSLRGHGMLLGVAVSVVPGEGIGPKRLPVHFEWLAAA